MGEVRRSFMGGKVMAFKKASFAGTWYPAAGPECARSMKKYDEEGDLVPLLDEVPARPAGQGFFGGIVPHAGWYFSGKTAYSVFRSIDHLSRSRGKQPDLFFLFGMHLPPRGPNYLFIDEGFETPLGRIRVNGEAAEGMVNKFQFVKMSARDSVSDNTTELQLPFIRHLFPEAEILSMGVSPDERALQIGETAFELARELGKTPCFIGSTDLTHYGPNYGFMPRGIGIQSVKWVKEHNDREIVDTFLQARPDQVIEKALSAHSACCPGAAAAAIAAVKRGGADRGVLIDYTTSYDRHPDSSFVGYAGVLF
jgi:AmmeMemoRadiSam system protein B